MIEPMQHVTVVCLAERRDAAVAALRDVGVVHVQHVQTPESDRVEEVTRRLELVDQAISVLRGLHDGEPENKPAAATQTPERGDIIVDRVLELRDRLQSLDEEAARTQRVREQAEPWGSFDAASIQTLAQKGIQVVLTISREGIDTPVPENAVVREVAVLNGRAYRAVIAPEGVDLSAIEAAPLPDCTNLAEIDATLERCRREKDAAHSELLTLRARQDRVETARARVQEELELLQATDGMGREGPLAYLAGYLPAAYRPQLEAAAEKHGWALRLREPDEDDADVPTLLRIPKLFQTVKTIFDFVGILPGYREVDVSVSLLIALTIFFGMILGDAGYGVLFLGLAIYGRTRATSEAGKRALNLFILMSSVTVLWGGLTANFFAIPRERLPGFMQGLDWLAGGDAQTRQKHVQLICFLIAGLHLSVARFWNTALAFPKRAALGHVGWAMLLWANVLAAIELIVSKGSFPMPLGAILYIGGIVLILSCGVNWTQVGEVLNLPFDLINSFVDVLSYIRLFAVGLSSYYIASSFNDMAGMVWELGAWAIPFGVIVVLVGHTLNILLGFMGVLVHGIRLNTLEFSNHMGLTWSGRRFNPLRRADAEVTP